MKTKNIILINCSIRIPVNIILCLAIVFVQSLNIYAQEEKLINSKKLIKDFEYLKNIIGAHPDPYTHISEQDFNAQYEAIKLTLNQPLSQLDFYKKAASLTALIKDGHSRAILPEYWLSKQRKEKGVFPYEMYLSNNNELFVLKKFNEDELPVGSRILSINGISVDSFLNKIDPYLAYEKVNFRNTIIDRDFEEYLYIAFGHSNNTRFEYIATDTLFTEVKNMPFVDWKKLQKNNREEREKKIAIGKPYSYEKIDDGIGRINIYAFFARDFNAYQIFLSNTFKEIQKDGIHSLVIDIRGNFGGWPKISSELFHYISDSYFKTMAKSSMKVSSPYRNNMITRRPYLKHYRPTYSQRRHYVDMQAILTNKPGTYSDEDIFFNEKPIQKNYEFSGDCYLLINRDSYSSASSFASTFQCYSMGTIIGEETGGTKIFRANPIYEVLGHSQVRLSMATTKLWTTCYDQEFQGVRPNIEYSPSIFELLSELDTQLIFTQRIIKKVRKKKASEK